LQIERIIFSKNKAKSSISGDKYGQERDQNKTAVTTCHEKDKKGTAGSKTVSFSRKGSVHFTLKSETKENMLSRKRQIGVPAGSV